MNSPDLIRVFYDKNGHVFFTINIYSQPVLPTVEQNITEFTVLSERNRETFDVLELPYASYAQDFVEASGYRVNLETGELEFTYPEPNHPDEPQPYQKPLTEQIQEMKDENLATMEALAEVYEMMLGGA